MFFLSENPGMLIYHPRGDFLNPPLCFAVSAVRITQELISRIYVRVFFYVLSAVFEIPGSKVLLYEYVA